MIPDDVQTLLRDCIESFEHLEILLLLRRQRDDAWTADAVENKLNLPTDMAADVLDHLRRWNIVEVSGEGRARLFRYNPGTPSLEATIGDLATIYDEDRLEVMQLMNKNAIERVRTSAMRAFADAFFVGGGKKKDG